MDQHADIPEASAAPDPGPQSIDDIAAQAIEIAGQRAADRAAGKDVPKELPKYVGRGGEARWSASERPVRTAPNPAADAPRSDAAPVSTAASGPPPVSTLAVVEAPSGWADDRKASFGRLPPEAQRLVLDHVKSQDDDYGRKSRDLQEQARHAEPFLRSYVDHHDYLTAQADRVGVQPHEIMSNVLGVLRVLTTGTPQERQRALAYVTYLAGAPPSGFGG